jgi:hypothetical protein
MGIKIGFLVNLPTLRQRFDQTQATNQNTQNTTEKAF